ncbi:hypothetical protein Hanom_Chr01g00067581 [Helianthus anomalus]
MLYTVLESHLIIDVHVAFNNIEVKRAEDCRVERERRLAEEATPKKKSVIEVAQEAGGSSSQVDEEMVYAEANPMGFVLKSKEQKVFLLKWKDEDKEEEEIVEEEATLDDDLFEIENYPQGDDDDDQGTSGLLIVNPNVQQRIEDFLNDEINEQKDDDHQEASTSDK